LLLLGGLVHPFAGVATELSMQVDNDLISVEAEDAPLQLLVEELAARTGLRLVQHVTLDQQVSVDTEYESLNQALDELLGEYSYQLFQAQADDGPERAVRPVPGTLWIFSEGESHAPASTIFFEAVLYFGTLAEKKEAIRELKRLATNEAVQSLSLALHDAEPRVRDAALEALSSIGSDDALAAIASTTQDTDPWIRNEAVNALSSGNADSAMQYLQMAMDDPDPRVRVTVVDALTDIPSEHAATVISRALNDPDEQVRERALDALDEVQATIAFDALMQVRRQEDK
jgi:vesicle coat complex subunit